MNTAEYSEYLKSIHWKQFRRFIFREHGTTCEECGLSNVWAKMMYGQGNNVHHITYARLGKEQPNDVLVLCKRCHDARHGINVLPDICDILFSLVRNNPALIAISADS